MRPIWYGLVAVALVALGAGSFYLARSYYVTKGVHVRPAGPPNVVLISLDTVRPDHLGCYGYDRPTSPHLDALAREGVRFTQARCQMPLTMPSHMALFTSMLPSHNTVDHFDAVLPSQLPTLAQLLEAHGYTTAAIVNDAQMKPRWGFNRGFGLWKEFPEDKPQGNCEHLTAEALNWLAGQPPEPFFLFLHYYDPHSPYDPPQPYREAFGSYLTGAQADRVCWDVRRPENPITNRGLFQAVIGSYDGEIAWLDHELGKLFARLPENTLVVVFSDHGEGFKEHGWWGHGATVYDEEIRSVLLFRHPGLLPQNAAVDEPVMLLDVMPTILNLCGIDAPMNCEGADLSPLWHGSRLPDRVTLSEVKSQLDGQVLKMAQLGAWKLVYSVLDGKRALYHLPDEATDRYREDPSMAAALFGAVRNWLDQEEYWILYAHGNGKFIATLEPTVSQFATTFVFDSEEHDRTPEWLEGNRPSGGNNRRWLRWSYSPAGKTRGFFFQLAPRESALKVDLQIDGKRAPEKVFCGEARAHPKQVPFETDLGDSLSNPIMDERFQPTAEGFYLRHHRGKTGATVRARVVPLDEKTLEQLRSLGYLR